MAINYINNKDLFEELKKYRTAYMESLDRGEERPQIPDTIASAIIRISTKLMNSYRFVNYPYKEEMIGDAILKCCLKVHLFNPERSENPFAYFTQIAWNEAISRIKNEQDETSVKAKMIRETLTTEFVEHAVSEDDSSNSFVEFLKDNTVYVDYIEERAKKRNEIHPSLKHRNKTAPIRKEHTEEATTKVIKPTSSFDLSAFEE